MAGRPRMMANRAAELYEAYAATTEELQRLMPQQYLQPTTDSLGQAWQTAVQVLCGADDYLIDLLSLLEFKAQRAEERAAVAAKANLLQDEHG